jgi:crotonobetainyl-CoA:carnitine CoA-transferase CaiB-like acyl-CoA transferase
VADQSHAAGALEGVRIIDLSRLVAGNLLTMTLADMGADVIKVEQPGKGDTLREWKSAGVSVHWKVYGRNKRSIALNLVHAKGREVLLALVKEAHILVESFQPGKLEQMGLGPEVLHGVNPDLVILRISGWGQDGPYAHRPGFGTLVEAMSGFSAMTGYEDRPPILPPFPLADMVAGLYGSIAALVALRHREVGKGGGQVIDLPLLDPLVALLGSEPANYRLTGKLKQRLGSRSQNSAPRNAYRTSDDRWLAISSSTQPMTERFFRALGIEEMLQDPRFRTNSTRLANVEALDAMVGAKIAERTLEENMTHFDTAGITAAPIYDVSQLMEDPHVKARQIIVEMPDAEVGHFPMPNVVPRLQGTPGSIRTLAPALGEHTAELLRGIGISGAALDDLIREGVVQAEPAVVRGKAE